MNYGDEVLEAMALASRRLGLDTYGLGLGGSGLDSITDELLIIILYYCIRQLPSLPLGWVVKLTPIRQLSSSLVLNLYQTNATDIK